MSPTDVRDILLADAAVQALVGSRIYPNTLPQDAALPAIVYLHPDGRPESTFSGYTIKRVATRVNCHSDRYNEAHAVAQAVVNALNGYQSASVAPVYLGSHDHYDDVTRRFVVRAEFAVWGSV